MKEVKTSEVELEIGDEELWNKIEWSNSMERVNASPLYMGVMPVYKRPNPLLEGNCSDCSSGFET